MPKQALIVASSLAGPCAFLREAAVSLADIEALLKAPQDDLRTTEDGPTITLNTFVNFLQKAAEHYGDGMFGWMSGRSFDLRHLGAFGHTVEAAPDVRSAIRLFCNAFALIQSDSVMTLDYHDDEAVVSYRILNPRIWPRAQDAEFTLGIISSLIERAAGPGWRPTVITTEHHPHAAQDSYSRHMHCPVAHNGSENAIRFPAHILTLPMARSKRVGFREEADALVRTARHRMIELPLTLRVRNEIARQFGAGGLSEAEIARALGYSERSMRRHLGEEMASYSGILETCRHDMARNLLTLSDLSIEEIASRLNYSDRSAFERSFRRVIGVTPSQFRRSLDSADMGALLGLRM